MTNAATDTFVTFAEFNLAVPYYMRSFFSVAALKRERFNKRVPLEFFRAPRHHCEPYWRTSEMISWFFKRFAVLPLDSLAEFERSLRRLAVREPPLSPKRTSKAGRPRKKDLRL